MKKRATSCVEGVALFVICYEVIYFVLFFNVFIFKILVIGFGIKCSCASHRNIGCITKQWEIHYLYREDRLAIYLFHIPCLFHHKLLSILYVYSRLETILIHLSAVQIKDLGVR